MFETRHAPLPAPEEQCAIVSAYRAELQKAADLEAQANKIEAEAAQALEMALGIEPPLSISDRPMFVANFKDIERWNHVGALQAQLRLEAPDPKFTPVELGGIGKVSYEMQKNRGTAGLRILDRIFGSPMFRGGVSIWTK